MAFKALDENTILRRHGSTPEFLTIEICISLTKFEFRLYHKNVCLSNEYMVMVMAICEEMKINTITDKMCFQIFHSHFTL